MGRLPVGRGIWAMQTFGDFKICPKRLAGDWRFKDLNVLCAPFAGLRPNSGMTGFLDSRMAQRKIAEAGGD